MITGFVIGLTKEVVSTSETSVNFYETTRRNIPEELSLFSHLFAFVIKLRISGSIFRLFSHKAFFL
jgi:hypothetical protein